MLLWIPLALATPLDDAEAACTKKALPAQAACWAALEASNPWSNRRLDWELRQLELGRTLRDGQAERRARRALAELRAGAWWVVNGDAVKPADATRAAEELRMPLNDEPAYDPAALGVTLPAGVSGKMSWLATDDPAVWAAARTAFHNVYDSERAGAAAVWEAWCAWQLGEPEEALKIHARAWDLMEEADEPDRLRRELEDQALLLRTATTWRPDLLKWAKTQPIEREEATAARLRELGAFADAVGLWRHLLERAPMDARAPQWHFALVRDLLSADSRKDELPRVVATYGQNGAWWEQQNTETRDRVGILIARIYPYRPESFGESTAENP
jgi:hypothetical protein